MGTLLLQWMSSHMTREMWRWNEISSSCLYQDDIGVVQDGDTSPSVDVIPYDTRNVEVE